MPRTQPKRPKTTAILDIPPKTSFPVRVLTGVFVAAALCFAGAVSYYRDEAHNQEHSRDPYIVGVQFPRLEGVRNAVPENAVLGYLTDLPAENITAMAMFRSAAYVLAPRLIRQGQDADWVLGNFTRPADFAALGREHGLRLQRDFGNGVVLYRKEGR